MLCGVSLLLSLFVSLDDIDFKKYWR